MDKKTIIIIIGLLFAVFAGWYLFGLHDNGSRTDAVRNQLDTVNDYQQSTIDRLGNIENGLDDSQKQVGRISDTVSEATRAVNQTQDRIEQSQDRVRTSSEIIADCQRILAEVRERGQAGEE